MIFFIEEGFTALRFIFLEFPITFGKQFPITYRFDPDVLFIAGGAVAGKSENIGPIFNDRIDDVGDFVDVRPGYGSHDYRTDAGVSDTGNLIQRAVEGSGLAEPVVRFTYPVNRQLIFLASERLQSAADLVVQMERIAENSKGDIVLFQQFQQLPEIRVKDRVAPGDIKIGKPIVNLAEIQAVLESFPDLIPVHKIRLSAVVFRKNIAVFTALIALVCNMPLEGKILFHFVYLVSEYI